LSAKHVKVVTPEALEAALASLEQRVSQLLAHLAAVFEREEAAQASTAKAKAKRAQRGGAGPGAGAAANASVATGTSPRTAAAMAAAAAAAGLGTLPLEGAAAAVTESDAAAHRMSVAALTDKASARVFQRIMTLRPDISDRNVRVNARAPSPDSGAAARRGAYLSSSAAGTEVGGRHEGVGVGVSVGGDDDLAAAMHKSAADLSKLLHGAGAGAVVDRVSLKRLSAMVATSLSKSSKKPGAGSPRYGGSGNQHGLGSINEETASPVAMSYTLHASGQ
jgi:hypothetical protein